MRVAAPIGLAAAFALTGCENAQSAFDPAGVEAARVLTLFWVMLAGGTIIWLIVIGTSFYAIKVRPGRHSERTGLRLIIWGGCVFPTVVLAALLTWGLGLLNDLRRSGDGPTIAVSGERFWWRVSYGVTGAPGVVRSLPQGGIPSANEIVIPLGQRTTILLGSPDVIHSFWVPPLAGKMDAIPGRVNRLILEPTKIGVYNGTCAEFCGLSHARMGLKVIVVSSADFDAYVQTQARPAVDTAATSAGLDLFMQNGCAACHAVRGTSASGLVGPDLTHLASRETIGAGVLPTTVPNIAAFVSSPDHFKPGAEMPAFGMLPETDIERIAQWLGSLK